MSCKPKNVYLDENYLRTKESQQVNFRMDNPEYGMDKEMIKNKLGPFLTTIDSGKGIGIGLSMVYGIVKSHGAVLTCDSKPDTDTSFEIFFPEPQSDEKQTTTAPAVVEPAKQKTETILLVDDEEPIQEFGKMILEKFGYAVLVANSGERAIDIYKSKNQQIDLVVLDLNMPGMGGQKCLIELVRINPDVKVVVASGFCPHGQLKQLMSKGATCYIQKPYMIEDILKSVRKALAK